MDNSRTLGSVLIVAGSALCSAVYKVSQAKEFFFIFFFLSPTQIQQPIHFCSSQSDLFASRINSLTFPNHNNNLCLNQTTKQQPISINLQVIYQRMFGFWSIAQMSLFFTLIGLFNAFLMWPVALLLYFLGVELIVCKYKARQNSRGFKRPNSCSSSRKDTFRRPL